MYPADSFPLTTLRARQRRLPGGVVVVELDGEVDLATEDVLRNVLADVVGAADTQLLVCDLTRVSFFSCTGLNILMLARKALQQRGAPLRVVARAPVVVMVFEGTDLAETLGLCASLKEAIGGQT
jgi:anti-anti-sigma factor